MPKEITFDRFIRWVGVGSIVLVVLLLVDYLSSVLLPFFVAWLFAYLLYPMVKFVENKLHVRVRALSIIITMIFVFAVIGGMLYFIIPPMIEQFQRLYVILTHWVHGAAHTNNISGWISNWLIHNQHTVEHFFKSPDFTNILKNVAPKFVLGSKSDGQHRDEHCGLADHLVIYVLHPYGLRIPYQQLDPNLPREEPSFLA